MCKILMAIHSVKQVLWKCYLCCYLQVLSFVNACLIPNYFHSGSGNNQEKHQVILIIFLTKRNCFGGMKCSMVGTAHSLISDDLGQSHSCPFLTMWCWEIYLPWPISLVTEEK